MSNLFDRVNYPVQEPDTIVVGDRLVWRRDDLANTYSIGSYALTYEFHEDSGGGGSHKFDITATEADNTYFVEIGVKCVGDPVVYMPSTSPNQSGGAGSFNGFGIPQSAAGLGANADLGWKGGLLAGAVYCV